MSESGKETGWTRGPWTVAENAHGVRCIVQSADYRVAVSHRTTDPLRGGPDQATSEANARLIAAAPALYEALVDVVEAFGLGFTDEQSPEMAAARSALLLANTGGKENG